MKNKNFIEKVKILLLFIIVITAFFRGLHILCVILFVIFVILWFIDNNSNSGHLHFN